MNHDEIVQYLKDQDFGQVDDHRYRKEGDRVVVETCSLGPWYTPKQKKILQKLAKKINKPKKTAT